MVRKNWIEPSSSAWTSPVLVIKKPGVNADGTPKNGWRFVLDLSATNSMIEPQQYHIPDLPEMYNKLQGSKYVSLIDLTSGYWLCPLEEKSRDYTSFTTPFGTYRYTVTPMGLLTSAAHFQRHIERKLRKNGLLWEPSVANTAQKRTDQAVETRQPIADVDDRVPCQATIEKDSEQRPIYNHTGCCSVYQDDLAIMDDDPEQHKENLLAVLRVLSKENLYVSANKVALFCKYVRYLGAICGNDVLALDPLKVEAITDMPVPKTIKDVRTFLGAAGFMRRWILHYSAKAQPLNDMLKKGTNIPEAWGPAQDKAVADIKGALASYPVLRQFDPNLITEIWSDACDYACGGAMLQRHNEKLCVVAYTSRAFRGPELNYSVQEKECLGVLVCVEKFRHYILHTRFQLKIRTDHESLQFLKTQDKGLVGRIARWAMKLSEYNFDIKYVKGSANTLADAISRLVLGAKRPDGQLQCILGLWPETQRAIHALVRVHEGMHRHEGGGTTADMAAVFEHDTDYTQYRQNTDTKFGFEGEEQFINALTQLGNDPELRDTPREKALLMSSTPVTSLTINPADYEKDKDFGVLYRSFTQPEKLTTDEAKRIAHKKSQYYILNGLLRHVCPDSDVICVPKGTATDKTPDLRTKIIQELHDTPLAGHRGEHTTYLAVRRRYSWPRMSADVKAFVHSCEECQASKKSRLQKGGKLVPLLIPLSHGTHYSTDFLTDLPKASSQEYNTCLVIVDRFSKRVYLIPTWKNADAETTAEQFFTTIVRTNGAPLEIVSDRDSKFTSNFWRTLWSRMGTSLRMSSARSQSTDGQTERMIAVVEEILRTAINYAQDNWVEQLPAVEFAINNSESSATGMAPLFLETGRHGLMPIDVCNTNIMNTLSVTDLLAPVTTRKRRKTEATRDTMVKQFAGRAATHLERVQAAHQRARDALAIARTRMLSDNAMKRRDVKMTVGHKVWLSAAGITMPVDKDRPCAKLCPVYYGPYTIVEQISPVSYRLKLPVNTKIHNVFHVMRLKSASMIEFRGRKPKKLPVPKDEVYEVHKILADRTKYGKKEYLVRWTGYSMHDSSWTRETDLSCPQKLKEYQNSKTI